MPFYNIEHSYPLSQQQKADFAERVTQIHATTFTTPAMFVHVKFFQQDASAHNHFVGGKHKDNATNRIMGYVRSSSSRTKEHFDKLAEDIEHAWYVVLGERVDEQDEDAEKKKKTKEDNDKKQSQSEKDAKELLTITLIGGIIAREKGFAIPEAGQEEAWVKKYRKDFQERADMGDEAFKDMLQEIEDRDDLKAWRA